MLQRSVPQASTHSMQQQVRRAVGRGLLILIVIWTLIALAGLVLLTVFDQPPQTLGPDTVGRPKPDQATAVVTPGSGSVISGQENDLTAAGSLVLSPKSHVTTGVSGGRAIADRTELSLGGIANNGDVEPAAGTEPEVEEAVVSEPAATAAGAHATPEDGGPPPETGELPENGEPRRDPAELPDNGGAEHVVGLPVYPWPPEDPSSLVRLDVLYDFRHGGRASLQDVADQLAAALNESGYLEQSFYQTSGGFVMVTRLEGIAEDGTPLGAERRYLLPNDRVDFSFADYIRSLFFAPEGYYRFVAFVITDRPYTTSEDGLEEHDALGRLRRGAVALPAGFDQRAFSAEHRVDALIYEFSQQSEGVTPIRPGRLPPRTHLEKSGLMSALAAAGADG